MTKIKREKKECVTMIEMPMMKRHGFKIRRDQTRGCEILVATNMKPKDTLPALSRITERKPNLRIPKEKKLKNIAGLPKNSLNKLSGNELQNSTIEAENTQFSKEDEEEIPNLMRREIPKLMEIEIPNQMQIEFLNSQSTSTAENVTPGRRVTNGTSESLYWESKSPKPKFLSHVYCLRNKVLLILEAYQNIQFMGKLKVRVLCGAVDIYGADLTSSQTPEPIDVYSPRGYSSVVIQAIQCKQDMKERLKQTWQTLEAEGVDRTLQTSLTSWIEKSSTEGWAILLLEKLENNLTAFLDAFCPYKIFPKIYGTLDEPWSDHSRAEHILQAFLGTSFAQKSLSTDFAFLVKIAKKIVNNTRSRCIVVGAKHVGKSTLTRQIINQVLPRSGKVIFLDLDLGQAECKPPGSVSIDIIEKPLLGPSFTHLKAPYYELFLGEINVSRCLAEYFEAVKMLALRLDSDPNLANLPVVVNTMGFTQGLGLDIVLYLIKLLQPTNVVQIEYQKSSGNFKYKLSKQYVNSKDVHWSNWGLKNESCSQICNYELHVIKSKSENFLKACSSWKIEPYQQRDLVMYSYFGQMTNNLKELVPGFPDLSIYNVKPYTIPLSDLYVSLNGAKVPANLILTVVLGNIVGLCGVDEEKMENNIVAQSENPKVLIRSPVATCYGHGIVRGIDIKGNRIYVITPLPLETLKHVNCLMGCTSTPTSLLQLDELEKPYAGGSNDLPICKDSRR